MKILLLILSVVLVLSLILGGCAKATPSSVPALTSTPAQTSQPVQTSNPAPTGVSTSPVAVTPKYGGVLRFIATPFAANIGWPASLVGSNATTYIQWCLETLLRTDKNGNTVPWLAESYKVADDMKSITLIIRKGIKFHDGSDLNAEVVKWNLDNMIQAKQEPSWASVEIIDTYTIKVNIAQWMFTIPASFAEGMTTAFIVSKAAFDKNGKSWMESNPVGTGPFKFVSYQQDVALKTVRNPDYWKKDAQGNQLPYLDGLEAVVVADKMTQKVLMQTGDGEMVGVELGKPAAEMQEIGMTVNVVTDSTHVLIPDTANADSPFANIKVREAMEYAIDREAIANGLGYGFLQAAYQIPSRGTTIYNPDFTLSRKYDVEKAKQLLSEAGYPDGFKTTLIVSPMSGNKDPAVAVQSYLAKIGIQAEIDTPDIGKWMGYMGTGTWPKGTMLAGPVPIIDPNFVGGLQYLNNMLGKSWLRTPEFTQAYQSAFSAQAMDVKLIRAATDQLTKEASLIPFMEGGECRVQQPYVVAAFGDRGVAAFWNIEEAWLNK